MPKDAQELLAWSRGGVPWALPAGVGIRIGPRTSFEHALLQVRPVHVLPTQRPSMRSALSTSACTSSGDSILSQMHFRNPTDTPVIVNGTGIQLSMTGSVAELQPAALKFIGSLDHSVPPLQRRFNVRFEVPLMLLHDAHLFSWGLHAHLACVKIEAWLVRDGRPVASLGLADPFDPLKAPSGLITPPLPNRKVKGSFLSRELSKAIPSLTRVPM